MRVPQLARSLIAGAVALAAGFIALLMTYALGKAALQAPRSFAGSEARLRHFTDRLVVAPDGGLALVVHPHPILLIVSLWVGASVVFIVAVVRLRRDFRSRPQRLAA
jgi:hypothetical protein